MLFNTYTFLLAFLPIVLVGFFQLARTTERGAALWLALASLFFYGYWNPRYVPLLLASVVLNYFIGRSIVRAGAETRKGLRLLQLGVGIDLGLLAYYKYANFFLSSLDQFTGLTLTIEKIVLPLGISFFTFTQIAFLADSYHGKVREYRFVHYLLFVTYFPHLVAGPVLHHQEMMPQFENRSTYLPSADNFAIGLTILAIGLFKKVIIADGIAQYVGPVFDIPRSGTFGFFETWGATLSYTLQLYFDFSGYSDMAIGLSRLFGILLPLNFDSPYKARNAIDFWRRWHMTLSRFLREYLYIPLGGNRSGRARRYVNLMVTMLLGGLWHGAGWTFVVWGGLHGMYLIVNHAWQGLAARLKLHSSSASRSFWRFAGAALTFVAVVVGWVFFRAHSLDAAGSILQGMLGFNGVVVRPTWLLHLGATGSWLLSHGFGGDVGHFDPISEPLWILALLGIVWLAPNTQQLMGRFKPALGMDPPQQTHAVVHLEWKPTLGWAVVVGSLALWAVSSLTRVSSFLYFQF
jgi:alginate O-acetyltransferase complex protein AlgI